MALGDDTLAPGYESVLATLREIVLWPWKYSAQGSQLGIRWPTGCLLHGPPGVGKTTLVKAAANESGARLFPLNASEVVGPFLGESERRVREVFEGAKLAAAEGGISVVFIDEIDALCPRRSGSSRQDARLVAQLLTLLDEVARCEHCVSVLAATNQPNALDPALRRPGRLDREVAVMAPGPQQRLAILNYLTRRLPLAPAVQLDRVAEQCSGYTGADLAAVCQEAGLTALVAAAQGDTAAAVTQASFEAAITTIKPSLMRGLANQIPPRHWHDISGYADIKARLQHSVEWPLRHPAAFKRLGVPAPRGVLLHGPPGCSKTNLARAVATSTGASVVSLDAQMLYSMYLGAGEAMLHHVFKTARTTAPAILFLDEIDALFVKRTGTEGVDAVSTQLLTTLLVELDGLTLTWGVVVLAATNRIDRLDPALLRPGRFDSLIYVHPPQQPDRFAILQAALRGVELSEDVDLAGVAEQTEGFVGAEVQHLCDEVVRCARARGRGLVGGEQVVRVAAEDLKAALANVRPGLTEQELEQYDAYARRFGGSQARS